MTGIYRLIATAWHIVIGSRSDFADLSRGGLPIGRHLLLPFEDAIIFSPFGTTTAINVFDVFDGKPDVVTYVSTYYISICLVITYINKNCFSLFILLMQVLLLHSGDVRNALFAAAKVSLAYPRLEIHHSENCKQSVARIIFISHIMLAEDFDSRNSEDIDYLWNV